MASSVSSCQKDVPVSFINDSNSVCVMKSDQIIGHATGVDHVAHVSCDNDNFATSTSNDVLVC